MKLLPYILLGTGFVFGGCAVWTGFSSSGMEFAKISSSTPQIQAWLSSQGLRSNWQTGWGRTGQTAWCGHALHWKTQGQLEQKIPISSAFASEGACNQSGHLRASLQFSPDGSKLLASCCKEVVIVELDSEKHWTISLPFQHISAAGWAGEQDILLVTRPWATHKKSQWKRSVWRVRIDREREKKRIYSDRGVTDQWNTTPGRERVSPGGKYILLHVDQELREIPFPEGSHNLRESPTHIKGYGSLGVLNTHTGTMKTLGKPRELQDVHCWGWGDNGYAYVRYKGPKPQRWRYNPNNGCYEPVPEKEFPYSAYSPNFSPR